MQIFLIGLCLFYRPFSILHTHLLHTHLQSQTAADMLQTFKVLAWNWIENQPAEYLVLNTSLKTQARMHRHSKISHVVEVPSLHQISTTTDAGVVTPPPPQRGTNWTTTQHSAV